MTTPLQTSRYKNGNVVGRQSFVRDPRKPRNSKLFSPLPGFRTASETTPTVMRTSSKFHGKSSNTSRFLEAKAPNSCRTATKISGVEPSKVKELSKQEAIIFVALSTIIN
ncbi:hypothetical protein OIU76_003022 [Salix suchowensis]|nr:hypothetical protein OIU76_003022 [Salix suchowensis]